MTSEFYAIIATGVALAGLILNNQRAALRGVEFDLLLPDGSTRQISGISGLREHEHKRGREERLSG